MRLGVCYYPEHWDPALWPRDAARMAELGLSIVRIGEFSWSRIEPARGAYDWEWLDLAIETLAGAGLDIMLGTPTATPPKWMIDAHPDMLAWDKEGRPRRFGSRRHYCFSSEAYREECSRIVMQMASRYGAHPSVTSWQTDNEYGCHDTVRSYSPAALAAFRLWLRKRYGEIAALNDAWGTVFWSQVYSSFEEVDLPNLTVTEPNPAHVLDFYRFSSDQVISFNRMQTDILRKHAPSCDVYHNFMGFFTDFDHFQLSNDIDVAGWDSYPLGFLDVGPYALDDKQRYMRQGHPDFAAFHHDLYRACGRGRFAVLEQQPGPVNWAHHNPAPLNGMVRLWTHEAAAHGAELTSYFRWRQAPFAQEQWHAGLLRSDDAPAAAYEEVEKAHKELKSLENEGPTKKTATHADIAMVFSYETQWMSEIQPQGARWNYLGLFYEWYAAARRFGCNIDILAPGAALQKYSVVLTPSLFHISDSAMRAYGETDAALVFGPRCGSKTEAMQTPSNLAPGPLQSLLPVRVMHSESFPEAHKESGRYSGEAVYGRIWLDRLETELAPIATTDDGAGLLFRQERRWLFAAWPDSAFLTRVLGDVFSEAGLDAAILPEGVRKRSNGDCVWTLNYNAAPAALSDMEKDLGGKVLLGNAEQLAPAGLLVRKKQ
ncbi:MAG: beta-galactosidase [Pseudomonadota bacterium]